MLHMFLSYCKSHIYDIHSLLVGTIIFFLIYVWKGSIDKMIEGWVNKRYSDRTQDRQRAVTRRVWGFTAVSVISPLVHNSVPASIISASFAITELEFYKTFIQKKR